MRLRSFCQVLCLGILAACISAPASANEALAFAIDQSQWEVGYTASDENTRIMEFVRPGESVNQWTEMATLHQQRRTAGTPLTAVRMAEVFRAAISQRVPLAHWEVISQDANSITIWWSVLGSDDYPGQHELMRYFVSDDSTYRIAFTKKTTQLSETQKKIWIDSLAMAALHQQAQ